MTKHTKQNTDIVQLRCVWRILHTNW